MDLLRWIKGTWNLKGNYDLHLGAKGFFTIIFFNIEYRDRVLMGGPYFFYYVGLFLMLWNERFNLDTEDLSIAPVWIKLYSLPCEYWEVEILEAIGNSLGKFVKASDHTKIQRYTTYARICVYMNLS